MSSGRVALAYSLADKYATFVIGFAATVVLARLLSPAEIGTFSIAYSFVALGHMLRELGVGEYVIQERELSVDRLRAAFFISILMAWIAAALLAAGSGPIALFYAIPELQTITLLLASSFLLVPFGAVTLAYMRREMLFGRLMVINIANASAGAAVSVLLAANDVGAISMAWGALAGMTVTAIGASLLRPPKLPWTPGVREVRRVLGVGSYVAVAHASGALSTTAPDLVIGKVLGAVDTGIFSKAVGLVDMLSRTVFQAVLSIALPHFSSQQRSGVDFKADFLRGMSLLAGVAWPFFAVLALSVSPVIQVLLGDQWDAAAPVARVLCIGGAISAPFAAFSHLFLATRGARGYASYSAWSAGVRVIAILVSVWFGLLAVAWGLVGASLVSSGIAIVLLTRRLGIPAEAMVRAFGSSVGLTFGTTIPVAVALRLAMELGPVGQLMVVAFCATSCFGLSVWLFRHPLGEEFMVIARAIIRRYRP